jgi:hypothetical protein
MRRKQVTYAHKRGRNRRHSPAETNSSPLQNITDPEQKISHSEMAHRMLKRSRRSGSGSTTFISSSPGGYSTKNLRISPYEGLKPVEGPLGSFPINHNYDVQTPHPTLLAESQRFKLESSRGLPLSPNHEFSPVPLALPQNNFSPARQSRPRSHGTTTHANSALYRRTSSSNLKENAIQSSSRSRPKSPVSGCDLVLRNARRITRSKSKQSALKLPLASPFASKPASPNDSPKFPQSYDPPMKPRSKVTKINAMNPKRALSDTRFNPNLPSQAQAQSTVNSPTQTEIEVTKLRRPSAPSATTHRPDVASWFASSNPGSASKLDLNFNVVHSPSMFNHDGAAGRAFGVDFNRPPSQLSYTSAYNEDFFGDAQGISTPSGLKTRSGGHALLFRSGNDSMESTDSENSDNGTELRKGRLRPLLRSLSQANAPGTPVNPPLLRPLPDQTKSPWSSDSLISPPTACQERAYSKSPLGKIGKNVDEDVNMGTGDDEDTLGLGLDTPLDLVFGLQDALPDDQIFKKAERAEDLRDLFDSLNLSLGGCELFIFVRICVIDNCSAGPRPAISRARSLDLEQSEIPALHSPARISPTKAKNTNGNNNVRGGRDRRGTIRASDFQIKHFAELGTGGAGGAARRTRSGTIVGPAGPRMERSGTVVGRPIVEPPRGDVDVSMDDAASTPDNAAHRDVLMSEVDESEDEMLLQGHWHDEDWVVAEPPSPVVPRNTRKVDWKKGWEKEKNRERRQWKLGNSIGSWGMNEHDEGEDEDDPLNLFG